MNGNYCCACMHMARDVHIQLCPIPLLDFQFSLIAASLGQSQQTIRLWGEKIQVQMYILAPIFCKISQSHMYIFN